MNAVHANSLYPPLLTRLRAAASPRSGPVALQAHVGTHSTWLLIGVGPLLVCAWLLVVSSNLVAMSAGLALSTSMLAVVALGLAKAIQPARRMLAPIVFASAANAVLLACFVASRRAGLAIEGELTEAYVVSSLAVPLAILYGRRQERVAAELASTTRELRVSRRRLHDAAVSERQRLQRDLHDSAQQRLVGMRVKVGLAQSSLPKDRQRTARLLSDLQSELETALQEMRSLANGVYPPVLAQYGLAGSLRAACERASLPVRLQTRRLGRYPRDVEGAIHFACMEALQNAEKHAGRGARAIVRLWQDGRRLRFAVIDSGTGFDDRRAVAGTGLVGMRDRIEAVGGSLTIRAAPGRGTKVSGAVPLAGRRGE